MRLERDRAERTSKTAFREENGNKLPFRVYAANLNIRRDKHSATEWEGSQSMEVRHTDRDTAGVNDSE